MERQTRWCNSKPGVIKHVKSLEDFKKHLEERKFFCSKKGERLDEFFVLGYFYLDARGNCVKAKERIKGIPEVVTKEELREHVGHDSFPVFLKENNIPFNGLKCAHCQKEWTIEDCFDTVVRQSEEIISLDKFSGKTLAEVKAIFRKRTDAVYQMDQDHLIRSDRFIDLSPVYPTPTLYWQKSVVKNEKGWMGEKEGISDSYLVKGGDEGFFRVKTFYHSECNQTDLAIEKEKKFRELFEKAGFEVNYLDPIKNEHCQCELCAPWFLVDTQFGLFKIGWRTKVINIDWGGVFLDISKEDGTIILPSDIVSLFKSEEVTKTENYIHAWGYEKAEKYLKKIFDYLSESKKTKVI